MVPTPWCMLCFSLHISLTALHSGQAGVEEIKSPKISKNLAQRKQEAGAPGRGDSSCGGFSQPLSDTRLINRDKLHRTKTVISLRNQSLSAPHCSSVNASFTKPSTTIATKQTRHINKQARERKQLMKLQCVL